VVRTKSEHEKQGTVKNTGDRGNVKNRIQLNTLVMRTKREHVKQGTVKTMVMRTRGNM
jgi:hypothetical protein